MIPDRIFYPVMNKLIPAILILLGLLGLSGFLYFGCVIVGGLLSDGSLESAHELCSRPFL